MTKKTLGTLMVSAIVISMIAGCGNESAGNGETASTAIETPAPETEEVEVYAQFRRHRKQFF